MYAFNYITIQVEGKMNRWNTKDFKGGETILHNTAMMDMRHAFVKAHRMYNTMNPHVNNGF